MEPLMGKDLISGTLPCCPRAAQEVFLRWHWPLHHLQMFHQPSLNYFRLWNFLLWKFNSLSLNPISLKFSGHCQNEVALLTKIPRGWPLVQSAVEFFFPSDISWASCLRVAFLSEFLSPKLPPAKPISLSFQHTMVSLGQSTKLFHVTATTIPKVRFIHMVMFIKKITLLLVTNFCLETCSVVDTECTKQKQPKEKRAYFGQQFRSKAHHHGISWHQGPMTEGHITSALIRRQEMMSVVSTSLCLFYVAQNHPKWKGPPTWISLTKIVPTVPSRLSLGWV